MVEGAVHQQFPQNIRRTGEAAGIEIHWQIQKDADAVEQAELFQLPPHTSPVIPAQKVPSGHQKEWDCHPGQYPGKPEISHGRHIRQGRGVVHHHQQDCRQTKEVQSRDVLMGIPPPCQDKSLHIVAGYLAAALRHFHLCDGSGGGHIEHLGHAAVFQSDAPGTLPQKVPVLLQTQPVGFHQLGVGRPHIAEVPRLSRDPGDFLLAPLVAFDKAVPGRQTPKSSADAVIGKGRPDEVDVSGSLSQVDGEAG